MFDAIEVFCNDRLRVDLIGALTAGLCLAYEVLWRSSDGVYSYRELVKGMLLAVGSYVAAALLVHRFNQSNRKVPSWVLVGILGSMILVGYMVITTTFGHVFHPSEWDYKTHPTLIGRIIVEAGHAIPAFFGLGIIYSLLTLPVMATIYYIGSLVRWMQRSFNS